MRESISLLVCCRTKVMDIVRTATAAAIAGGAVIKRHFAARNFGALRKPDDSFQTKADVESEEAIAQVIRRAYPGHNIVGEEGGQLTATGSEYEWIIDPLDGTENFVTGIAFFSTALTVCFNGEPIAGVVYDPMSEALYAAEKGEGAYLNGEPVHVSRTADMKSAIISFIPSFSTKRRTKTMSLRDAVYKECRRVLDTWSPSLDWCLLASGRVDAILALEHRPVRPDIRLLLLQEAGGRLTDFNGHPFLNQSSARIIGSNGTSIHERLRELATEFHSE